MNGGAPAEWRSMRSFRRDPAVAQAHLAPGTVPRIIRFASPYRRSLVLLAVLVTLDAATTVANPLLLRAIIDQGILHHRLVLIEVLAGVAAGLAVLGAGFSLGQRYLSARIGEGLIYDLRSAVFSHVQRMPIAFFTRTQTGALVSRLNGDVLGAQQAFTGTLSAVLSNLLSVIGVLAVMFQLSWQITGISLLMLPVFVLPARFIGRRLQLVTREGYNLNAELSTMMTERFGVAGALLVNLFGRHRDEELAFRGRAARVRDIGVTTAMYGRVFLVSLSLVAALATALVYGLGGRLAAEGSLDVGTVVALTSYLTRLYGPLTSLSNVRVDVMTALVSFERVFEVLDLTPAIQDAPDATELPEGALELQLDAVTFRYPAATEVSLASLESVAVLETSQPREVLHGVSFTAAPGQLVALVGPSGAGKTTISYLAARLYDVTSGTLRLAGRDVRTLTLESLRAAVGVVPQDPHLFHDTVRANLIFAAPHASEDDLWEALRAARAADFVAALADGLDTVVGDRGYRLSGGEKQRLAIARLLLKQPRLVILDEATAHLDSESEAAVQQALATALAGRTALVIAHRLSTVRRADLIVVLDRGQVVQTGCHDELLSRGGLYADLYRTQFASQDGAPATAGAPSPR